MNINIDFFSSFDGRATRMQYWVISIVTSVVLGICNAIAFKIFGGFGFIVSLLFMLVAFYINLLVSIKRWHDRNKSGWWTLIILIPLVGAIWTLIECGFLAGTEGDNEYGADPREAFMAENPLQEQPMTQSAPVEASASVPATEQAQVVTADVPTAEEIPAREFVQPEENQTAQN